MGGDQIYKDVVQNISRRYGIKRAREVANEVHEWTDSLWVQYSPIYQNIQNAVWSSLQEIASANRLEELLRKRFSKSERDILDEFANYLNSEDWGDWVRDSGDKRRLLKFFRLRELEEDFEKILDLGLFYKVKKIFSKGAYSQQTTLFYIPQHLLLFLIELWSDHKNALNWYDQNFVEVDQQRKKIEPIGNNYLDIGKDNLVNVAHIRDNYPLGNSLIMNVCHSAKDYIYIQDRYISFDVLAHVSQTGKDVKKKILTQRSNRLLENERKEHKEWSRILRKWKVSIEHTENLEIRIIYNEAIDDTRKEITMHTGEDIFHSRIICVDGTVWKLDNSLKDFGRGTLMEMRRLSTEEGKLYIESFNYDWKNAEVYNPEDDAPDLF